MIKKLDAVFSRYIRLRDSNEKGYGKCITCSAKKHWKEADNGHFVPRQHMATRYHEKNNHLQCRKCNGFEEGMQYEYGKEIDKRYGEGTADDLFVLSKKTTKLTDGELLDMINHYSSLVKQMEK